MFQGLLNSDAAGLKNLRTTTRDILCGGPEVVRDVADVFSFEEIFRRDDENEDPVTTTGGDMACDTCDNQLASLDNFFFDQLSAGSFLALLYFARFRCKVAVPMNFWKKNPVLRRGVERWVPIQSRHLPMTRQVSYASDR